MLKTVIALASVDLLVFAFPLRPDKSPLTVSPFSYNRIFCRLFHLQNQTFFIAIVVVVFVVVVVVFLLYYSSVTLPNIEIYEM